MVNNPKNRQTWIFDLLKREQSNYVDMFAKYWAKWAKSKTTFDKDWKISKDKHDKYLTSLNKRKEEASIGLEVEALKGGLKLKIDRLMFYQNQIEIMERQLMGLEPVTFIVANKVFSSIVDGEFDIPIEKSNELRKMIEAYMDKISKIEGDYISNQNNSLVNVAVNTTEPIKVEIITVSAPLSQSEDDI